MSDLIPFIGGLISVFLDSAIVQVVTRPASPIDEKEKPKSQRQRAKEIRPVKGTLDLKRSRRISTTIQLAGDLESAVEIIRCTVNHVFKLL